MPRFSFGSFVATNLETIDAAIQTLASEGIVRVSIGNESVETRSLTELLQWRDRLAAQEAAASNRPGLGLRFQQITPTYR